MIDDQEAERLSAVRWHRRSLRIGAALRKALRLVGLNHAAAVALLSLHDAIESKSLWPRGTIQTIREAVERFPGQVFRLAEYFDEKAPCPYCGKPEALIHLATLKTYCWRCSSWGQDPRAKVDVINRHFESTDPPIAGTTMARDFDGGRALVDVGWAKLWFDIHTGDAEGDDSLYLDIDSRERLCAGAP